ncbi:MAG: RnfABCDGE type electron transport complex subunit D [Candidatus Omnitrophica bacterium]|jgi:Na+-translocating ferredoxin:NAD+ oxidoreductase RnfD subunit|nr:RnfABCDGE type electron transport complex subunit D [Candidatus Omnitrophota bacterium]
MFKLKSIKTQLILYLLCFAVFLSIKDRDIAFLATTLIAVIASSALETIILFFKTKTFKITESSVITGLIVGYALSADNVWWNFVLASALGILSKSLIRFRKKHIFNPAGFGIFLALILFGASTQWKGTYLWYIVVPFGFYFAAKIRKIEIITGYAMVSFVLFGAQAILQNVPFWNIFGYFSYFYIFIMVIEPLTTPTRPIGKFLFGALLALLIFILTEIGVKFDAELFSLLALNMAVPVLNKISHKGGRT